MRHIQIYEDYSDEELQDLMGDLKSVGQTPFKPQLGKDYGWTSKLLEKNPGLNKSFPSISFGDFPVTMDLVPPT